MSADKFPRVFCIDLAEPQRKSWLADMQRKLILSERIKTGLFLAAIALAFCVVGQVDYEDQLAIQAERDAYTKALANCNSAPVLLTANK